MNRNVNKIYESNTSQTHILCFQICMLRLAYIHVGNVKVRYNDIVLYEVTWTHFSTTKDLHVA